MNQKKPDDNDDSDLGWMNYVGLGMQLAVTVTAMAFLGVWLDGKFKTEPVLTVVFSFLGISAGLYNFIKTVIKSQ